MPSKGEKLVERNIYRLIQGRYAVEAEINGKLLRINCATLEDARAKRDEVCAKRKADRVAAGARIMTVERNIYLTKFNRYRVILPGYGSKTFKLLTDAQKYRIDTLANKSPISSTFGNPLWSVWNNG